MVIFIILQLKLATAAESQIAPPAIAPRTVVYVQTGISLSAGSASAMAVLTLLVTAHPVQATNTTKQLVALLVLGTVLVALLHGEPVQHAPLRSL